MSEQVMTNEQLAATERRNEKVGHVVSTRCRRPSWSKSRCARPTPSTSGRCGRPRSSMRMMREHSARRRHGAYPRNATDEQAEAVAAPGDSAALRLAQVQAAEAAASSEFDGLVSQQI